MIPKLAVHRYFWMLSIAILVACGTLPTEAIRDATATSAPTFTSTVMPTLTETPALTPAPDFCSSTQWQSKIQVLSDDLFETLKPGNPVEFNSILAEQDSAWADFQQDVQGEMRNAGVIFHETSFGPEQGTGVNPAVILVTYGVERNWELPADGDLVSAVDHIRAALFQHRSEWVHNQIDRSQYPVANVATYALYRYFNGDTSKLEDWCHTYVQVYGESPLK